MQRQRIYCLVLDGQLRVGKRILVRTWSCNRYFIIVWYRLLNWIDSFYSERSSACTQSTSPTQLAQERWRPPQNSWRAWLPITVLLKIRRVLTLSFCKNSVKRLRINYLIRRISGAISFWDDCCVILVVDVVCCYENNYSCPRASKRRILYDLWASSVFANFWELHVKFSRSIHLWR